MLKVTEKAASEHVKKLFEEDFIHYVDTSTPVNGENVYITALKKDGKWMVVVVDKITPTTFLVRSQRNCERLFASADSVLKFSRERLCNIPVTFLDS